MCEGLTHGSPQHCEAEETARVRNELSLKRIEREIKGRGVVGEQTKRKRPKTKRQPRANAKQTVAGSRSPNGGRRAKAKQTKKKEVEPQKTLEQTTAQTKKKEMEPQKTLKQTTAGSRPPNGVRTVQVPCFPHTELVTASARPTNYAIVMECRI